MFSFSPAIHPGLEFLDHVVVLFLAFWGTSIMFSIVATPIYIPNNGVLLPYCFQHFIANICYLLLFDNSHLDSVNSYIIVVLICILMIISDAEHFFMCLRPSICLILGGKYIQVFCPLFQWVVRFVWYWVVWTDKICWILAFCQTYHSQMCLPIQ